MTVRLSFTTFLLLCLHLPVQSPDVWPLPVHLLLLRAHERREMADQHPLRVHATALPLLSGLLRMNLRHLPSTVELGELINTVRILNLTRGQVLQTRRQCRAPHDPDFGYSPPVPESALFTSTSINTFGISPFSKCSSSC